MIRIVKGNILESKAKAIINTVNTQGVMGKGIALQFKNAYPEMFEAYRKACQAGQVRIGKMHVWENTEMFSAKYIINFPTKKEWKQPSKLEYIEKGLTDLNIIIKQLGITSLAIPPLGCGNGGLDWPTVKSRIIEYLQNIDSVNIELYEPSGIPEKLIKKQGKEKK